MKNKSRGEKIQIFCSKYLLLGVAILVLIIGIFSLLVTAFFKLDTYKYTLERTAYVWENIPFLFLGILVFLLGCFIFYKITKKVKTKWVLAICLIIIAISQLLWICNLKFNPRYDQLSVIELAEKLLQKDFSDFGDPTSYFGIYPFQLGIIYYIAIIYKIFNTNNPLLLQILNVGFSIINLFLMYKITKQLFKDKKIEKVVIFLLLGFSIYFLFFNVFVYGNINGLTFGLIALYNTLRYLETKKIKNILITAITMAIAIILKSNYSIFLCGVIIILLLEFLKDKNKRTILGAGLILITYIILQFLTKTSLEIYTNKEIPEGTPMLGYLYIGMADNKIKTSGWYIEIPVNVYKKNNGNVESTKEIDMYFIKERVNELLRNPKELLRFYADKLASTWLNPTFQTVQLASVDRQTEKNKEYIKELESKPIIISMLSGTLFDIEEQFLNIFQSTIFIFAFYTMYMIYKKGKLKFVLLPIIFLGGFVFHVFWETKAIYVLQYYYLLIPYAAFSITKLITFTENKIKSKRSKKMLDAPKEIKSDRFIGKIRKSKFIM